MCVHKMIFKSVLYEHVCVYISIHVYVYKCMNDMKMEGNYLGKKGNCKRRQEETRG